MPKKSYSDKIAELEKHVRRAGQRVSKKEKCIPTMLIAGIVAPILLFLMFFFIQPSFVQKKEGQKYVRSNAKTFYWTIGVTVIIWIAMYFFTYARGYNKSAMFCMKK